MMFSTCAFLFTVALASEHRLISENQRLQAANGVLLKALRQINEETAVGDCWDHCGSWLECQQDCGDWAEKTVGVGLNPLADKCAKRTECIIDCVAGDESKRYECIKEICPRDLCVEETEVGCLTTAAYRHCNDGEVDNGCQTIVYGTRPTCRCPCTEEEQVGDDFWSSPTKDCYSFNTQCTDCRGPYDSCCHDKNCSGGKKCKAGLWSYSCA